MVAKRKEELSLILRYDQIQFYCLRRGRVLSR